MSPKSVVERKHVLAHPLEVRDTIRRIALYRGRDLRRSTELLFVSRTWQDELRDHSDLWTRLLGDVNTAFRDPGNRTLMYAVARRLPHLVRLLFDRLAASRTSTPDSAAAASQASGSSDGGAPASTSTNDAAASDLGATVAQLPLRGVVDRDGMSPLHYAARDGDLELATRAFEFGSSAVDARDCIVSVGWTALHHCARHGRVEIAQFLLRCGARVDVADDTDETPLQTACRAGNAELAKLLIAHAATQHEAGGASASAAAVYVNRADKRGATALHHAAERGRHAAVALLLSSGADARLVTDTGATALHLAATAGDAATVRELLKSPATAMIDAADAGGNTAVMLAAERGHLGAVTALCDAQADVQLRNGNDRNSLDLAHANGHDECVKVMMRRRGDTCTSCVCCM